MELTKKINVLGEEYVINMPQKNLDYILIESKKMELSEGRYWQLLELQTKMSIHQWHLINASAFFDVVAPAIAKGMVNSNEDVSVVDLEPKNSNILLKIYVDEIDEWFESYKDEAFGKEDLDVK